MIRRPNNACRMSHPSQRTSHYLSLTLSAAGALASCHPAPVPGPCVLSSPSRSTIAVGRSTDAGKDLTGRVLAVGTGAPLPGALIQLEPGRHSTVSDSAGRFRISDLRTGRFLIRVRYLGLVEARDSLTVGEDPVSVLAALAAPEGDLRECVVPVSSGSPVGQ
jgi:hypothetical protein